LNGVDGYKLQTRLFNLNMSFLEFKDGIAWMFIEIMGKKRAKGQFLGKRKKFRSNWMELHGHFPQHQKVLKTHFVF